MRMTFTIFTIVFLVLLFFSIAMFEGTVEIVLATIYIYGVIVGMQLLGKENEKEKRK